jgi:(p)ppGpp synthase/HD superfamily hydrolase
MHAISEENIAAAFEWALYAHFAQVDKSGKPYMGHVLRVASRVTDEVNCLIVALLHDVVEDSDVDLYDLSEDFNKEILTAVDLLTHKPGVEYMDFIKAMVDNPIAVRVKIADLLDNLDPARRLNTEEGERLRARHREALGYLYSTQYGTAFK